MLNILEGNTGDKNKSKNGYKIYSDYNVNQCNQVIE